MSFKRMILCVFGLAVLLCSLSTGSASAHLSGSPARTSNPAPLALYIGAGNSVYAINANTGAQIWRSSTGDQFSDQISGRPLASTTIFTGNKHSPPGNNLFSFARDTGKLMTSFQLAAGVTTSLVGFDVPALHINYLLLGEGPSSNLHAVNAQTGAEVWGAPVTLFRDATLIIVSMGNTVNDFHLFVGDHSTNSVFDLNPVDGTQRWQTHLPGGAGGGVTTPAFDASRGMLYVGSSDHHAYGLNATTGAVVWSFLTQDIISAAPTVSNGVVYVGSFDHHLYALNASTGQQLWRFTLGATTNDLVQTSPRVDPFYNQVYIAGTFNDTVYALQAATGALLWTFHTPVHCSLFTTFVVDNGLLYVPADNFPPNQFAGASVFALNRQNGTLIWRWDGTPGDQIVTQDAPLLAVAG